MLVRNIQLLVAIGSLLLPNATLAQERHKVGTILDDKEHPLYAWVNKIPGQPPSLHVIGSIVAPTPCHETVTTYEGDSKSNPPVYRIKVSIVEPRAGACPQVISAVAFRYDQPNYAGSHQEVEVFSDTDSKVKGIEVVQ